MDRSKTVWLVSGVILTAGFIYWFRKEFKQVAKTAAGTLGLTRGLRNNNPGNIIKTDIDWKGEVPGSDSRFETFKTLEDGIAALLKLLKGYKAKSVDTPSKIINKYAPSTENDTQAYINHVTNYLSQVTKTTVGPNTVLSDSVIPYLANVIMWVENGIWVSNIETIKSIYAKI